MIIAFLILLYLVRLITIAWIPLAPDEAYYWYWAKHTWTGVISTIRPWRPISWPSLRVWAATANSL